jgi:hypothetical protein
MAAEASTSPLDAREAERVHRLLTDAATAVERRDVNEGWAAFGAARRVTFVTYSCDELLSLADVLRGETSKKLVGWRKDAATSLLTISKDKSSASPSPPSPSPPSPPPLANLQDAQRMLDERASNIYRQLEMLESALGFVVLALAVLLAAMFAVVDGDWIGELNGTALGNTRRLAAVMLLGALGSMLSLALTRLAPDDRPIPEIVQSGIIDFLRPVLGAASAVALVLVIESGIQSAIDPDGLQIYVWAVLAGFSELLLRRTLNSVSASAQSATSPTTPPDTDDSNGDAT